MLRSYYISACFRTWLHCETSVYAQMKDPIGRRKALIECMQCAEACFQLLFELACRPAEVQEAARRCLEGCESCAAACEQYNAPELQRCAMACRRCSRVLQQLVMPFILN